MVEQTLVKNAEELKPKFQVAIKEHHTTQRKVAKYCNTNEFQFSKANFRRSSKKISRNQESCC